MPFRPGECSIAPNFNYIQTGLHWLRACLSTRLLHPLLRGTCGCIHSGSCLPYRRLFRAHSSHTHPSWGVRLTHYLDDMFTRDFRRSEERCRQGEPPDGRTLNWLSQQGDLTVTLLSGDGPESSEDRSRLLELLLCLANLHESLRGRQSP